MSLLHNLSVVAPPSAVVILSGGMDSATLLALACRACGPVTAIGVDYGQRHRRELDAAQALAAHQCVPFERIAVPELGKLLGGSSLTDPEIAVPDGHYEAESMRATVVPNRNMILLSLAIGLAASRRYAAVAYGAHAGDHAIYPDCRPEFVAALSTASQAATDPPVSIWAPFLRLTKADIAKLGHELRVPFRFTWSCYKGGEQHCGTCGTCTERREAFELAGIDDPTIYAS